MFFIWNDANVEHIARHNVEPWEAEQVVRSARRPYPKSVSSEKWLVKGRTRSGRALQVIYVQRPIEEIELDSIDPADRLSILEEGSALYVIHALPLQRGEL